MSYRDHLSTETLAEHAEGLLVDAEAAQVEAHLRGCADCRAEELLLISLQDILAADDPGPMPARYAARIDAALAEVAMTDPLRGSFHSDSAAPVGAGAGTQSGAATAQGGRATEVGSAQVIDAQVIDLASRRRTVVAGFRRVSTVAASVVLLIGGAALGAQVLNSDPIVRDQVAGDAAISVPSEQPSAGSRYALTEPPEDARDGANGSKIDDRTGIVYKRDGTNLYPDGTIVRPPKRDGGEPKVIPSPNPVGIPPGIDITPGERPDDELSTAQGPESEGDDLPSAGPRIAEAEPTPERSDPAVASTAEPGNETRAVGPQAAAQAEEPYVAQSGATYSPDNFASKVVGLLQDAGVRYEASSTGEAQVEPDGGSSDGDAGNDSGGTKQDSSDPASTQDMAPASFSAASTPSSSTAAKPGDRGPGDRATQNRVSRCGEQLGVEVLAADVGFWKGQQATILVVPNPNDERQVIGYVLYGPCTDEQPASAAAAEWEQPVQKPGAPEQPVEQPAESASPTREP